MIKPLEGSRSPLYPCISPLYSSALCSLLPPGRGTLYCNRRGGRAEAPGRTTFAIRVVNFVVVGTFSAFGTDSNCSEQGEAERNSALCIASPVFRHSYARKNTSTRGPTPWGGLFSYLKIRLTSAADLRCTRSAHLCASARCLAGSY